MEFISIGIVSDDNREYYAISKDFNVKKFGITLLIIRILKNC
jgi:hypothetical protein